MRAMELGFHTGFPSAFVPVSVTQRHLQKFLNKVGQALLLGSRGEEHSQSSILTSIFFIFFKSQFFLSQNEEHGRPVQICLGVVEAGERH